VFRSDKQQARINAYEKVDPGTVKIEPDIVKPEPTSPPPSPETWRPKYPVHPVYRNVNDRE
jgi:hypothetical protein